MAWVAVNKNGSETIFEDRPVLYENYEFGLNCSEWTDFMLVNLPKGTIKKILGYELTFETSPVEI